MPLTDDQTKEIAEDCYCDMGGAGWIDECADAGKAIERIQAAITEALEVAERWIPEQVGVFWESLVEPDGEHLFYGHFAGRYVLGQLHNFANWLVNHPIPPEAVDE